MTGATIGEILPYAIGVAISPVPIIAVILMLLAPKAGGASAGFLVGWVVGIVVATCVVLAIATQTAIGSDDSDSGTGGGVKLVLGILLILLAGRQWRGRPRPGEAAALPAWLKAIDSVTPARAVGLGFVLSAVNPKNLLLIAAAAVVIAGAGLSAGEGVVVVAVFTVLAACTVAIPVIGYAVAKNRMQHPLDELKAWLEHNNATVMAVLLFVIGVAVLGKGITALSL